MTDRGHDHDCRVLAERLSELVDGELPEALRLGVEAHINDCANCERFVTSLRRVSALGRLVPPPALSPERLRALGERAKERLATDGPDA